MSGAVIPSPRNKALDLLARREHSVAELRAKLVARDFEIEQIDVTLVQLVDEGLVSDERFVEAFVSSRIRKGQGPIKIRAELLKRGVAGEMIERQIAAADVDWNGLARSVRARKFGHDAVTEFREKARQSRFLQQRGFSSEQIRAALNVERLNDDCQI